MVLYGCSASTGSRYEKEKVKSEDNTEIKTEDIKTSDVKEDFDITPYKVEIIVPEKKGSER